jgi:hypothetical protein
MPGPGAERQEGNLMSKAKNVRISDRLGLLFAFAVAAPAGAEDWIFYGMNQSTGKMYYDQSSITRETRNLDRVWTKIIYSETGRKKACSFLESIKEGSCDRKPVNHELTLLEIDCASGRIKIVSTTFYTEESDPVFSTMRSSRDEWEDIVPDSVADRLKSRVCSR